MVLEELLNHEKHYWLASAEPGLNRPALAGMRAARHLRPVHLGVGAVADAGPRGGAACNGSGWPLIVRAGRAIAICGSCGQVAGFGLGVRSGGYRSCGTFGRVTATRVRSWPSPAKSSGLVVYSGRSSAMAMDAIIRSAVRRRGLRPAVITAAVTRP